MGGRTDRDPRVAEVLADAVAGRSGRWLVAGELPAVRAALADAEVWHRTAIGGRAASAWPPDGPFDGVALRLPVGAEATRMTLHALAARLAPEGVLVLAGANDEGIRSAPVRLDEVFTSVGEGIPRRHCRVIEARGPRPGPRATIEAWSVPVEAEIGGGRLAWSSWPGLFAHGRLDDGTRLLLEALPDVSGRRVLDFACGAGVVARFLLDRGAAAVDASDVDALAAHATALNVPEARVHLVDGLPPGGPWDLVVSNPPLHAGKDMDRGALEALVGEVRSRLAPDGALIVVTHATVPLPRLAAAARLGAPERLASSGGAGVWRLARQAR